MKIFKLCFHSFKLLSGPQVLNKSYTTIYHDKNILRSLPVKWRPNVTAIHKAKNLNKLSLENLISSLKIHEIDLIRDEPTKKSKSIALKSKGKAVKAHQAMGSKKEVPKGDS